MPGPKSYFIPGWGYVNETNNAAFFIPGSGYVNEQKFFLASLALTQPASSAAISGVTGQSANPGSVAVFDAMQGGLLAANDQATSGLSLTDTALYDVQITESV